MSNTLQWLLIYYLVTRFYLIFYTLKEYRKRRQDPHRFFVAAGLIVAWIIPGIGEGLLCWSFFQPKKS